MGFVRSSFMSDSDNWILCCAVKSSASFNVTTCFRRSLNVFASSGVFFYEQVARCWAGLGVPRLANMERVSPGYAV